MRGVPLDRRAISPAAALSIGTFRIRADLRTISSMSDGVVELEAVDDPEARPQGRGEQTGPRRGANEGELLKRDFHRPRARSLADDDVELVVFERGIEDFFDRRRHPVNLVDEQHLARREVRQDRRQIPGPLEDRPGGRPHRHAELVPDDVGQRRLPEPGRSVEQDVVERFVTLARRRDRHLQIFAHPVLADVVVEHARAEARLILRVFIDARRRHDAIVHLDAGPAPGAGRSVARDPPPAPQIELPRELPQRLFQRLFEVAARCPLDGRLRSLFGEGPMIPQVDQRRDDIVLDRRRLDRGWRRRPRRRSAGAGAGPSVPARSARPSSFRHRESRSSARCPRARSRGSSRTARCPTGPRARPSGRCRSR